MRLKIAIRISEDCGLNTLEECYRNIEIHAMQIFPYDKIEEELAELHNEIDELCKSFGEDKERFCQRTIKEIKSVL